MDRNARSTLVSVDGNTRSISTSRKLLFSLLVLIVGLVVFEGAIRLRAWYRYGTGTPEMTDTMLVPDPKTGLSVPRPGHEQHSDRIGIKINSLGFRGDEITVRKPPNTVRIATVGASTTFCAEVSSNEATWPAQLQEILRRAHPEVTIEVINAGVPGYVAAQSLTNLEARVLPLEPDLVIYYEVNNDLAHDTRALAQREGLLPATSTPTLTKALSRHSLLFDLAQKNARILLASRSSTRKLGALPQDLPERYIEQLDAMRRVLAARNVPFVTSTFFVKYRRDQSRETQLRNASIAFYYMPWMTIEGLLDGIDLYNDAIVRYAKSRGIPVVDDRDSIPGDDEHFADWAHFNDAGAALMGRRFAGFLQETGLIQKLVDKNRTSTKTQ
jgi:lysophospholipase L1-like esterase